MPNAIYTLQPEVQRPVGGNNVAHAFSQLLTEAGREARILYASPSYRYAYANDDRPACYDVRLHTKRFGMSGWRQMPVRVKTFLAAALKPKRNEPLELAESDVVILPEFDCDQTAPLYPRHFKIVLAQDVRGFAIMMTRHEKSGAKARFPFDAAIVTSEASRKIVERYNVERIVKVPLWIDGEQFAFRQDKKLQIVCIPRKRPEDAPVLRSLIAASDVLKDIDVVEIANTPQPELERLIGESLIFLSLSHLEGFGLPPAEAMSTGCAVVGYTGVGGDEYFTDETGYVVRDGDWVEFIETLEALVTEYRASPEAIDAKRRRASDFIRGTYAKEKTRSALMTAFETIDTWVEEACGRRAAA